jgi:Domain of unknown function (DUF4345)
MLTIYWPQTLGEQMGFIVAALTALIGLAAFLMPRLMLRLVRLQPVEPDAVAEGRAGFGGMLLALGLGAILLAQPLVTLVLGGAWAMAAAGRAVSFVVDRSLSKPNAAAFLFETLMAAGALAGVLGWVA